MLYQLVITKIFKVLDAIDSVLRSNIPIRAKLNCVVMRGLNEDEIINFVDWTQVSSFNNTLSRNLIESYGQIKINHILVLIYS